MLSSEAAEAEHHFQIGRQAWATNDLSTAETALRHAHVISPENPLIRAALGATLLKTGRINEGYPLFDAWREIPERAARRAPALPVPRWRGQPVEGKRILIWSEDGFGDQIMWARYAKALQENGADVVWLCPRVLADLFEGMGITVWPDDESAELQSFAFYCPSSALPLGFDLSLPRISGAPYLPAPTPTATGARIGVMTNANPNNSQGAARSLLPEAASRLLSLPRAIHLAPEATGARTFRDTAAIIAGLDLVVTVDTSIAHLAGALGKLTWVLLPHVGDWRWFTEGNESPWYSSVRLFRQERDGEWTPVIERIADTLRDQGITK